MKKHGQLISIMLLFSILMVGSMMRAGADTEAIEGDKCLGEVPPLTLKQLEPRKRVRVQPIHPDVKLLDVSGKSVVQSGKPLSLMKTCGKCHDTDYIARHNYHSLVGLDEQTSPGEMKEGRSWDTSPGMFGRWNPLIYRLLTPCEWETFDMGTADWIKTLGARHVGGGPAVRSRCSGKPLIELGLSDEIHPDTHILDSQTGKIIPWDWKKSGTVELNCLICHIKNPNNAFRVSEIKAGNFQWASTATLVGTGLVEHTGQKFKWQKGLFDRDGKVSQALLPISDPADASCRLCHGKACRCIDPVIFENSLENWAVETTGEVYSGSRMFDSGMNLENKKDLSRPWDIHAARLLKCTHCHYSLNNPGYNEKEGTKPEHLHFDARKLNLSNYLLTPDHNFAKGHTAQGTVSRRFDTSMRDCQGCHNALAVHDFLPYKKLHFKKLSCRACHIKEIKVPVRISTDWTLLSPEGTALLEHRGISGPVNDPSSIIHGSRPCLLMYEAKPGEYKLGPHNVITSWFWVEENPERPVRLFDLKQALFIAEGKYHNDVIQSLDTNKDGVLIRSELLLDSLDKVETVKNRLVDVGVKNPRIKGEIQQFTLGHGVATGKFAMRNCLDCHSYDSAFSQEVTLARHVPGNVMPAPLADAHVLKHGDMEITSEGQLVCIPTIDPEMLYIHGTSHLQWFDYMGIVLVLGSLFGVLIHGGIRIFAFQRRMKKAAT